MARSSGIAVGEFRRPRQRRALDHLLGAVVENHMSNKNIAFGLAALIMAAPVAAQQRGTLEFGAFGSTTAFDNSLFLDNGTGCGVRLGAFLDPRWSLEFDGSGLSAGRPLGLRSVQVTSL